MYNSPPTNMTEPPLHNGSASNTTAAASTEGERSARFALPFRQLVQRPAAEPNIHDITEKFRRACSGLQTGQLVKDESFTLFESIGALEIMDPKMDSGFLEPGETIEENYDTLKDLLPEELIGIMDQLLCYEMAWHSGYPLSQTLFTSVYIDKLLWPEPKVVSDAQFYRGRIPDERRPGVMLEVLRAYCLALIKCCDFVIAKVQNTDFFEEEDICTHTYNRVLFVMVPMDVFLRELDAMMQTVQDAEELSDDLKRMILVRLEFRKNLLTALDIDCPMDRVEHYWPQIHSNLLTINETHSSGKPVKESFSTKIQRRLASTVPPRPIVELEFKDAFEKLKQLCTDCEEATRFIHLEQDPLEYESFFWAFSSRNPPPLPYSRAYLSTLLFHPTNNLATLFQSELRSLVLTASPVLDPINWTLSPPLNPQVSKDKRINLAQLIDEFTERANQTYSDIWIALGQNRCRLRRLLCHVLQGLDQLQSDASSIDEELQMLNHAMGQDNETLDYPLTTWTYHKKLLIMEKVILLGFEQDIYIPDEFAGQYHFLSIIASTRSRLLTTISTHLDTRCRVLVTSEGQTPRAASVMEAANYIDSLLAESIGIFELSAALCSFYTILLYTKLLPEINRPFSTPELRYELRMKPFLILSPAEVPPFEKFKEAVMPYGPYHEPDPRFAHDLCDPDSVLWTELAERIKSAKTSFAQLKGFGAKGAKAVGVEKVWSKDVQGLLASCIALGVAVAGVKAAIGDGFWGEKEVGIKVEVPEMGTGKRYAEAWVVGKVGKL